MNAIVQKYYKALLKVLFIAGFLLAIYISVTYLLPFFAPFVIGIILAFVDEPVIKLLEKKVRMPRKLAAFISLVITISVLGVFAVWGIVKIYNELVILKDNISNYVSGTSIQINDYIKSLTAYYNRLPDGITRAISDNINNLAPKVQEILTSLVTYLLNTISSIPKVTVFVIVCVLSTYFISSDRKKISGFLYRQFPDAWMKNFSGIKTDTFTALFGYLKAILILMLITFIEVSIGLTVMRIDYALLMGLIVALSDAIPILGTGIVMVPWIAWNIISGNIETALGLSVIYVLGVIIRQILEPKIVGDQIGLHPLATLIAMYIGLSFLGILGMFIGPISIIILKNLQSSGLVKVWKD